MPAVHSWGSAIQSSVASGFAILLSGIPKIIGFLLILIIGWIIASLIAAIVDRLLHAVKFNDVAERSGVAGFVRDMGVNTDSSGVLSTIVKWFIRLIVLVAAFDALGLPTVSHVLNSFLLWIPNLVVALVVLVIGGLIAKALSAVVRGATAESGLGNPNLLATLTKWTVWGFAFIVALNQIGIAATLVDTLFMGFVGAMALAFGLAFGLGGRETASRIVQGWYQQSQQAQMQQAAQAAVQQTQLQGNEMPGTGPAGAQPAAPDGRTVQIETRPTNQP
ncbi:MAG TPA: small-conductance mechanosensitive ion channel [Chloroflexota bacterium]|nr:small-conductance mechanosensitive ion channel [Chloroflexota bacterium]